MARTRRGLMTHINNLESRITASIKDLESRLNNTREDLRLIREQISGYTESEKVSLDLKKNERRKQELLGKDQKRLEDLRSRLRTVQQVAAATAASARPSARPPKRASECIQVIGWRGIEPPLLYKRCTFADSLAFLTTEMSFNILPSLWFCPSIEDDAREFNVIYVDFEFIERYSALGRIEPFDRHERITEICGPRGPLEPAVRGLVFNDVKHVARIVSGVPIQFGFNEVLINKDGELGDHIIEKLNQGRDADWSYSDFHLDRLLADEKTKIAFWHWYIPSLTHILLSIWAKEADQTIEPEPGKVAYHGEARSAAKPVSLMGRLKQIAYWDELNHNNAVLREHLGAIAAKMRHSAIYRDRIMICNSLSEIRDQALDEWRAGIVLGIGSSVLSGNNYGNVESVIPREGVPVWINCAAALHTQSKEVARAADLIQYWVQDDTQLELFREGRDYTGLPVNRYVLERLQNNNEVRQSCHALRTFAKLYDRSYKKSGLPGGKFASGMVATRRFPRGVWTEWVGMWESFVREAD